MSDDVTRASIEAHYVEIAKSVSNLDRSWIMTSGAGCGKTYQMVERYVAIIEQGFEVSSIIAVTFTEKAAAELKNRVREQCRERMSDLSRDEDDRRRWGHAARQLAMAPVSTIHGLCGRLLRENAIAAGVDPNFSQLDAMAQGMLVRDVVRETLLDRLRAGEKSAEGCVERWRLGGATEMLQELVEERESLTELLAEPPDAEDLHERWEAAVREARCEAVERVLADDRWIDCLSLLTGVTSPPPGDKATERIQIFADAATCVTDATRDCDERIERLLEALGVMNRRACGAQGKWKGRENELEAARDAFCTLADVKDDHRGILEGLANIEDLATARLGAAVLREAGAAAEAYDAAKREQSALDFADLQILARDLLRDNPDVLARMQRRYQHVLIDEFQDTNALQKEIIWRIAGADPITGEPPEDGGLFVVGDAKQSIYGFRSADVSVFNRTASDFIADEAAGPIPLETTRRSRPRLVAFFNALFSQPEVMGCERGEDYEASYQAVNAYRDPHPMHAEAELILISKEDLAAEPQDGEAAESVGIRAARQREAEVVAARIREIVDSREPKVWDKDTQRARPPSYGDFGMLFQAMSDVGIYEYALRRAGVPFYTVAGRGFYNRQEIRDCLNFLQVLENTANEVALAGVLRSPMFGLSDDTLFFLTREHQPLMAALHLAVEERHKEQGQLTDEQLRRLTRARDTIRRLRAIRDRVGLSELIERMLAETGLGAVELTQFAGRQAAANLAKLTDLARSFEQRGAFSLREFIAYLSDLVLREPREGLADVFEEGADVVKLMTVHAAKGLEWPIVVVPDLGRDPHGRSGSLRVSAELGTVPKIEAEDGSQSWGAVGQILHARRDEREEAERRRLLYVALTRARDMLLLSSALEFAGNDDDRRLKAGYWLTWITEGLALDCLTVEDGHELAADGWRVLVKVPAPEAAEIERLSPGEGRAELAIIAEARSREPAPLPDRVQPLRAAEMPPGHLSVTALQCYRDCPQRFHLRYLLGLAEAPGDGDWLHGLSAARRGDLSHRVLEIVGRGGLDDRTLESALSEAIGSGALATRVTPEERGEIENAVRWLIEDAALEDGTPLYKRWIAEAVRLRAEAKFIAPLAGARVEGTIDALAEDADGAWRIVDYKTGKLTEEKRGAWRFQVGLYCAAVQEITGALPADAAVVMLDEQKVLRIDPRVAAPDALEAARGVIDGIRGAAFASREDCRPQACALAYACQLA